MPTLSIVVPAYNERRTLLSILARVLEVDLRRQGIRKEIVVVDDGSTDGTREVIEAMGRDWRAVLEPALLRRSIDPAVAFRDAEIRTILQPRNFGKGAALRTGFQAATGDFVVVQDADLEYDPADYPRLLAPLLEGRADAVYGSRFLGEERRVLLFWHAVGNWVLTTFSNMLNDLNLTDMETCYKAFRAEVIKGIHLTSDRFGFEPEVTAKLARMRCRIYEVPIRYSGRGYEAGKKITWKDGFEAIWCIVKFRLTGKVVAEGVLAPEILEKISRLRPLNEHVFKTIRPWIGRRIVEAGSGHGNITEHLLGCGEVVATDVDPGMLERLRLSFGGYDNARVARWDMREPLPSEAAGLAIDTVVCLNVLEHLDDDGAALASAKAILEKTGGCVIVIVPAAPPVFSPLDERLGRLRRYTPETLRAALERAGFTVEALSPFNLLGLPGWWLNARILGNDRLPAGHLAAYNLVSRFWLPIERVIRPPRGLSLVAVGRVPATRL